VTFRNLSEELRPQFVLSLFDKLARQIDKDPDKAGRMVSHFCAWLRSLQNMSTFLLVPLRDELQFFNIYLDIERLCHGQKLNVEIRFPSQAQAWPVPPLLLQSLVEAPLNRLACDGDAAAVIVVKGLVKGSRLEISMDMTIPPEPGMAAGPDEERSQPLKAKLAALYGEDSALNIRRGENGSSLIELSLPFRELQGPEQTGGSACAS
jgi:LytS/YehU family sensor histidine kinase